MPSSRYKEPVVKKLTSVQKAVRVVPRLSWQVALVLILIYFLQVIATSYAIYHKHSEGKWTNFAIHLFPYPAAVVRGEVISVSRVRLQATALNHQNQKNNIKSSQGSTEQFVIDQTANRILYRDALEDHNIQIKDTDVDNKMNDIYKQVGGEDKLQAYLKDEYGPDMTLAHFRSWVVEGYLSEAAVDSQLLNHASVRHIVLAIPDNATPEQVDAIRQKLVDIKSKIKSPSDFAGVAKEYSEDVASRDKGGDIGTTTRGEDVRLRYSQDFEDAIFSLPIGQVSDPIRTPKGWHLVIVDKREGSIDESLTEYTTDLRGHARKRFFYKPV